MVETSKRGHRLRGNALIYGAMVLIGAGLVLFICLMGGCGSTSKVTPPTVAAKRTTESRGPTTTLRTRVILPKAETIKGPNP